MRRLLVRIMGHGACALGLVACVTQMASPSGVPASPDSPATATALRSTSATATLAMAAPTATRMRSPATATQRPTGIPLATPTQTATPLPSFSVDLKGVTFTVPAGLAHAVEGQAFPGHGATGDASFPPAPWMLYPPYLAFDFEGYVRDDTSLAPQLVIYPVADYERLNATAAEVIQETRQALAGQPAVPEQSQILPIFNAHQSLRVQFQYVDFTGGAGFRFVTQYVQDMAPINNHSLFYTFQGLTSDGAYYVAAILPVSAPVLPADYGAPTPPGGIPFPDYDRPDFTTALAKYQADVTQLLNGLPASEYSPSLKTLDSLMQSMTITAWTTARECPTELSSALQAGAMAYVSLNPPVSNRLRAASSSAASLVGSLPSGTVVDLSAGPVCADDLIWWLVVVNGGPQDGLAGWTAEGSATEKWLVACPAGAVCPPTP